MKKICHLSSHHSPYSVRIFKKQCRSLAKAGYRVSYVVPGDSNTEGVVDGVDIVTVKKSTGFISRVFLKPYRVYKRAKSLHADLYHFHDPELLPFAYLLLLKKKKVIYDIHEDLPAKIKDLNYRYFKILLKVIAKIAAVSETFFVNRFTYNIAVNEDIKLRFKRARIGIITNYPLIGLFEPGGNKSLPNKIPVVIYAGLLNRIRGIKEIVDAVGLLKGKVNLKLLGTWQQKEYEEECKQSSGWQFTDYPGMLPLEEAYKEVEKADIGIVNFMPLKNHLNSMPNKAFEYMAAGKPMVMSNFPYWKELFSSCAVFADPANPEDIAEKINLFATDTKQRDSKAKKARTLIESEFSWESEEKKLIQIYESVFLK